MKSKLKKSELRQLIKEELNNFNENENKELPDVEKIKKLLGLINNKAEYLDLLNVVLNMGDNISGMTPGLKKTTLLNYIKTLGK